MGLANKTQTQRPPQQQRPQGGKRTYAVPTPEDQLVCEVVEVKEVDIKPEWDKYNQKTQYSFKFKILSGYGNDPKFTGHIWGNTPPWWNDKPNCKLRLWCQEIMGVDYLEDVEPWQLEGKLVVVTPYNYTNSAGELKAKAGEIRRYSSVSSTPPGMTPIQADFEEDPF